MIVANTPIQWRLYTEGTVPSPSANNAVDTSEIVFTTDTGRLIIGPSSDYGNPNYDRSYFPYTYTEVLTENSPRVSELFQLAYRDQDSDSFLIANAIAPGSNTAVTVQDYDGARYRNILPQEINVSSSIDYHAFMNGAPVTSGKLRVLASNGTITSNSVSANSAVHVQFYAIYDIANGYVLNASHNGANAVTLYLKQTAVGQSGALPTLLPPVWNTSAGSLGTFYIGNSISLQLSATDPNNFGLNYFVSNGSLSNGLSLVGTGRITGNIQNSSVFSVRASDGKVFADQNFTMTAIAAPSGAPSWQTGSNLGTYTVGDNLSLQVTATDALPVTYSIVAGSLPSGITMSNSGLITGSEVSNSFVSSIMVRANNGSQTSDRVFTFNYFYPSQSWSYNNQGSFATLNSNYNTGTGLNILVVSSNNTVGNYAFALVGGALPPGMVLGTFTPVNHLTDPIQGNISGTTPTVGTATIYNYTLRVTDTDNSIAVNVNYWITVNP